MADVFFIASIVLLTIFVCVATPALLQLRRTLRTAESFLDTTGAKLNRSLDEVSATTQKLGDVAERLDNGASHATKLFTALGSLGDSVADVSDSVSRINRSVRQVPGIMGAVGAAAVAGVRAVTRGRNDGHHDDDMVESGRPASGASGW
jgi:ABC-type transporter Mla subunit MlaD